MVLKAGMLVAQRDFEIRLGTQGAQEAQPPVTLLHPDPVFPPYTPQQNGLCERFIKTFKEELCWTQRFATLEHARMKIRAWIDHYNHRRPHQALNYRTPAQQHHLHPTSPCQLAA